MAIDYRDVTRLEIALRTARVGWNPGDDLPPLVLTLYTEHKATLSGFRGATVSSETIAHIVETYRLMRRLENALGAEWWEASRSQPAVPRPVAPRPAPPRERTAAGRSLEAGQPVHVDGQEGTYLKTWRDGRLEIEFSDGKRRGYPAEKVELAGAI